MEYSDKLFDAVESALDDNMHILVTVVAAVILMALSCAVAYFIAKNAHNNCEIAL